MAAKTRLGYEGYGVRRTGSFAGKTTATAGEKQGLLRYIPEPLHTEDLKSFITFVQRELARISSAIDESRQFIEYKTQVPDKPKTGVFYVADGVGWDPGGGKGVYVWYNNQWNKL